MVKEEMRMKATDCTDCTDEKTRMKGVSEKVCLRVSGMGAEGCTGDFQHGKKMSSQVFDFSRVGKIFHDLSAFFTLVFRHNTLILKRLGELHRHKRHIVAVQNMFNTVIEIGNEGLGHNLGGELGGPSEK